MTTKPTAPGQWANQQRIWQEKEEKKDRLKGPGTQQIIQGTPEADDPVDGEQAQERRDRMNATDKPEGERKE
jgi:hypothetical protein